MAKWIETIPLNPDDQKFFEADKLAHRIEDCFDSYNAPIKIKEGLIKSTCADWRANFHAPRGKKSQKYFVYFKIF